MTSYQKISSAVMMLGVLGTSMAPIVAHATTVDNTQQSSVANSQAEQTGTWGTAFYSVTNGVATIGGGTLSGMVPEAIREAKTIKFVANVICPADSSYLFSNLQANSIDGVRHLNTQRVQNMTGMFAANQNLTRLDLSSLNTSSATVMQSMFYMDTNLSSLNLSNFNTRKVKDMSFMFGQNFALTSLDLSSFYTNKQTTMNQMFDSDISLQKITLGTQFQKFVSVSIIDAHLPSVPKNSNYTGKWQNVGTGTVNHPNGENVWTSSEFMKNYDGSKDADTYVWQPKSSLLNSVGSN